MMQLTRFVAPLTALLLIGVWGSPTTADETQASPGKFSSNVETMINNYCVDCHNSDDLVAELDLESISLHSVNSEMAVWEKVVRKMRARQMPPDDSDQPSESATAEFLDSLESKLDAIAAEHPDPGRTDTFRRLTRTEYKNAIRDLLLLDIDVNSLLPADQIAHGFDNVTVGELSPTLVSRHISAARKIGERAIGGSLTQPGGTTIRVRPDVTQEQHTEGLPIGTRGGVLIPYTFPQDGDYEIRVRLARDRNEHIEGLSESHELEILVDLQRVALLTVKPPKSNKSQQDDYLKSSGGDADEYLKVRFPVSAGPHEIGVTFLKNASSLLETKRQPLNVHFNMYRHPRINPAVYQVSITGPFAARGSGNTPSRNRVFICQPSAPEEEDACAKRIISTLLRRATRQPIDDSDLIGPMALYHQARQEGDFEDGIELALSSVLVHPKFLFRVEQEPSGLESGTAYQISDVELASRLSFFLWSSIPDEQLLELAERGKLSDPDTLEQQTRRMLADDRSRALVTNFASQWLYLRNLDAITPDGRIYPDFDDNLRQAFRRETEMFFESIMREDRSVVDLLKSDYTFLNERLAKHYGIPNIYGSRFRRVNVDADSRRGGLLRHGSILTVTSYATRTSPVIRGKWILENILGSPPAPPPANVPALKDNSVSAKLPVRQRLAQHRADPACAGCHKLMDPIGFALENFDAVGRWRDFGSGRPIDAAGGLPGGEQFTGVAGLEKAMLERPDQFVGTMTEKLLTYAIGRGYEHFDAPAVRKIMRSSKDDGYRFSSLIVGIVQSTPFRYRMSK